MTTSNKKSVVRRAVVLLAAGVALLGCSKASPSVLGIDPTMSCNEFAEAAFPLHQNYRNLAKTLESEQLDLGPTFLTKASLADACARSPGEKGLGRFIYLATATGTPIQVTLWNDAGFKMDAQAWFRGSSFSDMKLVEVVDGKVITLGKGEKDARLEEAKDRIIAPVLSALGKPLLEAKVSKSDEKPAQFWRRGKLLVCRGCGGFIKIRSTRKFLEEDLADSPEIDSIADALRKDGAEGL